MFNMVQLNMVNMVQWPSSNCRTSGAINIVKTVGRGPFETERKWVLWTRRRVFCKTLFGGWSVGGRRAILTLRERPCCACGLSIPGFRTIHGELKTNGPPPPPPPSPTYAFRAHHLILSLYYSCSVISYLILPFRVGNWLLGHRKDDVAGPRRRRQR